MKKRFSCFFQVAVVIAMVVILFAIEVYAEVIYVTTRKDNIEGSLRAAITTANSNNEPDTIYLPIGTFYLTGTYGEDNNAGGDLDFNSSDMITIIGKGRDRTLIDAYLVDRVLHVLKGTVSITGVDIKGGKTADAGYFQDSDDGGGIKNSGTLILTNCMIRENVTGRGGAHNGEEGGKLGNSGSGGGIYNSGSLTLSLCEIQMNDTGDGGGVLGDVGGNSGSGGAIFNSGSLTITDCTINTNYTGTGGEACSGGNGGSGAGIHNTSTGNAVIEKSTITNNSTGVGGNADCSGGSSHGGNGGNGGGIYNEGIIHLSNCTLSANDTGIGGNANGGFPGYGGSGGGIYNLGNSFIFNCTIVDNVISSCSYCSPGEQLSGDGGGIYNHNYVYLSVKNTIIANNRILNTDGEGPDCWGTIYSEGYNLIENTSQCYINGNINTNIIGQDPILGPLSDNGGPTQTHALSIDSPAIDAGNSQGILEDQRGFTRPQDIPDSPDKSDGSDIGAYELVPIFSISGRIKYSDTNNFYLSDVTLTFSNNGGITATDKSGFYSLLVPLGWSGEVTPTKEGYIFYPASRSFNPVQYDVFDQDFRAESIEAPVISLNRTQLYFGATSSGIQTDSQTFMVTNSGSGILGWTVNENLSWLYCFPSAGTNSGTVSVSINTGTLAPGIYSGVITVNCPQANNNPQEINIVLNVYNSSASSVPFGFFETPTDAANLYSSIPVTGWVLDDIGVDSVKIYRSENKDFIYIGDAIFVEGARPDVEIAYPGYPSSYKAGWGYMLLTNFLPNGGNGTFILHAIATDIEGNQVELGQKTIHVDNANAVLPFGAIDSPAQGGIASGTSYRNQGWALTPLPNKIPEDGHTLKVWIDGVNVGNPIYNIYRSDIATLFPGYANSNGAMAYFDFDTTGYDNGVHTIEWNATDNAGNSDGIGSRYFSIQNAGQQKSQESSGFKNGYMTRKLPWKIKKMLDFSLTQIPCAYSEPIGFQEGYYTGLPLEIRYPGEDGNFSVEIKELTRIEIHLDWNNESEDGDSKADDCTNAKWWGVMAVGDDFRKLPIGSSLDSQRGIFRWMPGVGFLGSFRMVFVKELTQGNLIKKIITFHLIPKF